MMGLGAGASVALAIKIVTDSKGAGSGIDQVTRSTSKLGKAGQAAGKLLAVGLGVAVVAGKKAADAALEDATGQAKLANALKNATGARAADVAKTEAWVTAQGQALGVADSELRPALENLVTATKDVGKAQELAAIAMDISARKGLSLESVSKTLAKATATGNVTALAKYGVATKDADGKTRALADVQADLAKAYKGAAAANPALKQKQLAVATDELQEKYGAKLVPVLLKAASAGLAVVAWIDQNEKAAAAIVITLASVLAIVKLVSVATTLWTTATTIATAAQKAFNFAMAANPVGLVVLAVVALVAVLVIAYKRSETFRNIVNKAFGAIATKVSTVVGFIKNNWQKMLGILTGPIGLAVLLIVKHWDKIKAGGAAVVGWIKDKWSATKDLLSGPIDKAKTLISTAIEGVKTALTTVKDKADTVGGQIKGFLETAFTPISTAIGWVQSLIDKIAALIEKIKSIPTPDIPFVRTSTGTGGTGSSFDIRNGRIPARNVTLEVRVERGFIGSDRQLAIELKRILGDDLRRLAAT